MNDLREFNYGNYHLQIIGSFIGDKKNNLFYGTYTSQNGYMVIVFKGKPSLDGIYATYNFETVKGLNEYYMLVFGHKVTDTIFKADVQRIKNGNYSFLGSNPLEDKFFLDLIDIERMDIPKYKPIDELKPEDFKDFEGRIFMDGGYKEVVIFKGNNFKGSIDTSEFGDVLRIIIN